MPGQEAEAKKALQKAKARWAKGQKDRAINMLEKSLRMNETDDAKQLLEEWKSAPAPDPSASASQRASAPGSSPSAPPPPPTESESSQPSQPARKVSAKSRKALQQVVGEENYYKMLGVPNLCGDENILKKAYREQAKHLHPDKCSHPKAEEAFKKVSRAYQCLSDSRKKQIYDQYGTEEPPGRQQRRHQGEMTADEIFAQVFGHAFGMRMPRHNGRRHNVRRQHGGRQQQQGEEAEVPAMSRLLSMAPILVFVLFSFVGSSGLFGGSSKPFRLEMEGAYPLKRQTSHGVTYYVARDFDRYYRFKAQNVEDVVEGDWHSKTQEKCWSEKHTRDQKILKAKLSANNKGKAARLHKAHASKTDSCTALEEFRDAFSKLDQ